MCLLLGTGSGWGGCWEGLGPDREPEHLHPQELVTSRNKSTNTDSLVEKESTAVWPHRGAWGSAVAHAGL